MSSGGSSAVCAKTKAMYGMRLMRRDYEELINNYSLPGLVDYLKEHPLYGELLKDADSGKIRRNALENIIRGAVAADCRKIRSYMADHDKEPLMTYLRRSEVEFILRLIINLKNKSATEESAAQRLISMLDTGGDDRIKELVRADSLSELSLRLRETKYAGVLERYELSHDNTVELEAALYDQYMNHLLRLISKNRSKEEVALLKRQLGMRIDIENIRRTIRMQRYFPELLGCSFVLGNGYRIGETEIRELIAATDQVAYLEAIMPRYAQYYKMAQHRTSYSSKDKIFLSMDRATLGTSDTALSSAIAYLGIKTVEVKNIIHIIEGIRYGLPRGELLDMIIGISDDDNFNG